MAKSSTRDCGIEGCAQPAVHRQTTWCSKHYKRWRRNGDPNLRVRTPRSEAPPCSIDDCDGAATSRGWCKKHYTRWERHGDPLKVRQSQQARGLRCVIRGCENERKCRGWCDGHYRRWRKTGSPHLWRWHGPVRQPAPKVERLPWPERFWDKVYPCPITGCWLWAGYTNEARGGYGTTPVPGRAPQWAHRVAYELCVGSIPPGLHIDHLCRVRWCVNPDHLQPVTSAVNTKRGMAPNMVAHRNGTCRRNHARTPENTYVAPGSGKRMCRVCTRLRSTGSLPPLPSRK